MRGLFGLVSLLIVAALVAYLWSAHTAAISSQSNKLKEQVTQLSGHDENGNTALTSIKTEPENDVTGRMKSLVVTYITPGGAMQNFYGFEKGDKIVSEGPYDITISADAGTASAMLLDAFEKFQVVEVIRQGKRITLPANGSAGKLAQEQFNQLQNIGK